MIGIEGQFLLEVKTETDQDISYFGRLKSFVAIEECGLLLPVFNILFSLTDLNNLSYFHEGSILKAAFGKNKKDLKYINLHVIECSIMDVMGEKIVKLTCTLFKTSYSKNTVTKVFKNKCSIEIMKSILSSYFTYKSNISLTSDRQDWVQFGISDKNYIEYLWLNSYLDSGFLALGCSSIDNIFVVKDIAKEFTKLDYDFRLTNVKRTNKDLLISKLQAHKGNYGFFNSWCANDYSSLNYNLGSDEFEVKDHKIASLLSTSNKNPKNKLTEKSINKITYMSNNKYAQSYNYNLFALANYSKVQVEVDLLQELYPIKLLDKVYLDLNQEIKINSEFISGNYIVSKVTRSIANNQCLTKLIINRESPGNIKGKYL